MKVEIYGKPYDQNCQAAMALLKTAGVKVKFYDTDHETVRKRLITLTKSLQKLGGVKFKSLDGVPQPIVISAGTNEVIVGYNNNPDVYEEIIKKAQQSRLTEFMQKYPEWSKK